MLLVLVVGFRDVREETRVGARVLLMVSFRLPPPPPPPPPPLVMWPLPLLPLSPSSLAPVLLVLLLLRVMRPSALMPGIPLVDLPLCVLGARSISLHYGLYVRTGGEGGGGT